MAPVRTNQLYGLMNAHDGKYLRYTPSSGEFDIAEPDPSGSDEEDFLFMVIVISKSPLTLTFQVGKSDGQSTERLIALNTDQNIEATDRSNPPDNSQQWEVSEDGGSGTYRNFYTLMNVDQGGWLSRNLNSGEIVISTNDSNHRSMWKFVHKVDGRLPSQDVADLSSAEQDFQDDKQDEIDRRRQEREDREREEQEQEDREEEEREQEEREQEEREQEQQQQYEQQQYAQQQYQQQQGQDRVAQWTAQGYIPANEYNAIVQPMGYPGVPMPGQPRYGS